MTDFGGFPVMPITAECSRKYKAAHDSGHRNTSGIRWIVIHDTEGDTAQGAAAWFQNPKSTGSAHLVVDDRICYRTLRNDQIPWAAPGANTKGFHIEMVGFASWTRAQWERHDMTLRRGAFKAALHSKLFNIPLVWVGPVGLKNNTKGLTTHAACTQAFGGDHTDPGKNFPKTLFRVYAEMYREGLDL